MLSRFISMAALMVIGVTLGILVMVYGWGLHPLSWFWIMGVGFLGQLLIQVVMDLLRREK